MGCSPAYTLLEWNCGAGQSELSERPRLWLRVHFMQRTVAQRRNDGHIRVVLYELSANRGKQQPSEVNWTMLIPRLLPT